MFDKLIVSEPEGAEFHTRRGYFLVSSLVVGALFVTAVVISIYAADFTIGNDAFDISVLRTQLEVAEEPEPPKIRESNPNIAKSDNALPTRQINQASVNEPTIAPTTVSTVASKYTSRPPGDFQISKYDSTPSSSGRRESGTEGSPSGFASSKPEPVDEPADAPPPIAAKPRVEEKPVARGPQSLGIINGRAAYLPKPPYPAAAMSVNVQGKVNVQVTIDESGKVISAHAVDGNVLLRGAAERAAWLARFTPTLLSNQPVKVTGVIVYNFTR